MRGKFTADWALVTVGLFMALLAGGAAAVFGYWVLLPLPIALLAGIAYLAWRRVNETTRSATEVVRPNVVLIVLPTVLASYAISLNIGAYLTALLTVIAFAVKRPQDGRVELTWACAIVPAVALAILFRPNYPTLGFHVVIGVLACVVVARAVCLSESKLSALVSSIDGVGLFLVASLVLWYVGFNTTQGRTIGLDNSFTGGSRAVFPLSSSLAATPAMASVYVAAAIPVLIVVRRHRIPRLLLVACAAGIFVLSGSRTALLSGLFLAAAVLLVPRLFRVVAPWFVGAALIVPFVFGSIQDTVGRSVTAIGSLVPGLIRSSSEAFTLSGRDYIWTQAIAYYADRIGWVNQMLGFGAYGHAESGASASYYRSFGGLGRDDRLMTPHNTMLQILFDGGWLFALILAGTLIGLAWKMSRDARIAPMNLPALAMLVALSIVSITEVTLSPGHAQPTWWVLLTLTMITFAREQTGKSPTTNENSIIVPNRLALSAKS